MVEQADDGIAKLSTEVEEGPGPGTKPPEDDDTAATEPEVEAEEKTNSEKEEDDLPDKTDSVSLDLPVDASGSVEQVVDPLVESESAETVPPAGNEVPEDEESKPPDTAD